MEVVFSIDSNVKRNTLSGLIFARINFRGRQILDFSRRFKFANRWFFDISRGFNFADQVHF